MAKHKYDALESRSPGPDAPLENVMFDIASQANGHLEKGLKMLAGNEAKNSILFQSVVRGPVVRSKLYLHSLQQSGFNPCTRSMTQQTYSQVNYQIRLLNSRLFGNLL